MQPSNDNWLGVDGEGVDYLLACLFIPNPIKPEIYV